MKKLSLGLFLLAALTACDTNERCVANCDEGTGSTSEEGSSTDAQESDGDPTGGAALTCEDVTALAHAYIETHRACETLLDCELPSLSVCLPGAKVPGIVALSLGGFSSDEWYDIDDALDALCPCENPVSAGALCNEAGECQAFSGEIGGDEFCPSIPGDAETFLAANKGCITNADCVAVESTCYVDDCSVVALNADASTFDWMNLDSKGFGCTIGNGPGAGCNLEVDCTAEVECSDQGQCITVP